MKKKMMVLSAITFLTALLCFAQKAEAVILADPGSTTTINGAIFEYHNIKSTGSGIFDPFVRLGSNDDTEQGYNTSGRTLGGGENKPPFDAKSDMNFTHDLTISDLANNIVNIGGIDYYEFLLDSNESKGQEDNWLSLTKLEIYLSAEKSLTTENLSELDDYPIWDLRLGPEGDLIEFDSEFGTGSGSSDLRALIPKAPFVGGPYIYFYSQFGPWPPNDSGFEEWGERDQATATPEPASMTLLGLGLLGLMGFKRREKK